MVNNSSSSNDGTTEGKGGDGKRTPSRHRLLTTLKSLVHIPGISGINSARWNICKVTGGWCFCHQACRHGRYLGPHRHGRNGTQI